SWARWIDVVVARLLERIRDGVRPQRQIQFRTVSGFQRDFLNVRLEALRADTDFVITREQGHGPKPARIREYGVQDSLVHVANEDLRGGEGRRRLHRTGQARGPWQ